MALFCELESMINESDVEQKFIYPFLNSKQPIGLNTITAFLGKKAQ